jgi:hypothetical protein
MTVPIWIMLDNRLTMINQVAPLFTMISEDDPRPARDQLDAGYRHGGGWMSFVGHTLNADDSLSYPGDPSIYPVAMTRLRDETILVYPHDWVAIVQPDRSFEVCRMD